MNMTSQAGCQSVSLLDELGLDFARADVEEARAGRRLLSLDLELSRSCNFRCVYCYASSGSALACEMTVGEIVGVVDQACRLGARRIIVVGGGEPTLFPGLKTVVQAIRDRGASAVVFTNGTGVDAELAEWLLVRRIGVVLKLSSFDPAVQDRLCGHREASVLAGAALDHLLQAGYAANGLLGTATVICQDNVDEVPAIWRWARQQGIVPYMETLTPQGRGKDDGLTVTPQRLGELFHRLTEIDVSLGLSGWEPHPPFAAMNCHRHLYSCYVRSDGVVQPCSGVDVAVGNIRTETLESMVGSSPVLEALRYAERNVTGRCRECDLNPDCYGCRGSAFQATGDYLASDPVCWR